MGRKLHPLVEKTKIELKRLDKIKGRRSWEEQRKYNGEFLPISVEPKLRTRALRFMSDLTYLLEANGHSIKFEYDRCHIAMYDQLTEINLRQKYFRKRIKNLSGYSTESYEKSDKLEFQVGYHARKGWIDRKTKSLEDYLQVIYDYIEKDSKQWADWRERQRIQEEKDKILREQEAEKARLMAIEAEKLERLILDVKNYEKALKIRTYLKALEEKVSSNNDLNTSERKEYLKWAYKKADDIDPLSST